MVYWAAGSAAGIGPPARGAQPERANPTKQAAANVRIGIRECEQRLVAAEDARLRPHFVGLDFMAQARGYLAEMGAEAYEGTTTYRFGKNP